MVAATSGMRMLNVLVKQVSAEQDQPVAVGRRGHGDAARPPTQ